MKNSTLIDIKNSKLFKPFDIIIYVLVFILVLSLFFAFSIFKNKDSLSKFKVEINNKTIMTFDYQNGLDGFSFFYGYENLVLINQNDNIIECKIYINQDKIDYNTLLIDLEDNSVKMKDANCKNKDCAHFSKLSSGGSIVCVPHNLVISSLNTSPNKDIVVG